MSMISEQCDKLQCQADYIKLTMPELKGMAKLIEDAIDTIKTQAEKLHAYAMERSSQYYHNGWIPCSDRLPSDDSICLITIQCNDDKEELCIDIGFYNSERNAWNAYAYDCDDLYSVIAWRPLPEPYEKEDKTS